jgi:hypothetical protein
VEVVHPLRHLVLEEASRRTLLSRLRGLVGLLLPLNLERIGFGGAGRLTGRRPVDEMLTD